MDKRKLLLVVAVSSIISGLVVFGLIKYFDHEDKTNQPNINSQLSVNVSTKPSVTPSIPTSISLSITPIVNSYDGWKTYTNDKYKFSFKYDSNLDAVESISTDRNIVRMCDSKCTQSFRSGIGGGQYLYNGLYIIVNQGNPSRPLATNDLDVKKEATKIIGGKQAEVYTSIQKTDGPDSGGIGNSQTQFFIKDKELTYIIIYDNKNLNPNLIESQKSIDSLVFL